MGEFDVETWVRRYWLRADQFEGRQIGDLVRIDGEELHHIRDVCRQGRGDRFEVLLDGGAHFVEIIEERKRESIARILEIRTVAPLASPQLHLVLSIPRLPVFETVLEKCVELGVASVQPVFSQQSFFRSESSAWSGKQARFQKIIKGATQQCGRGELMRLEAARPLSEVRQQLSEEINRTKDGRCLFAFEGGRHADGRSIPTLPIRKALQGWAAAAGEDGLKNVWIFVGGEGGFSFEEVEQFRELGWLPTTLGEQVLRVETACVALVAVLRFELGLMREPTGRV